MGICIRRGMLTGDACSLGLPSYAGVAYVILLRSVIPKVGHNVFRTWNFEDRSVSFLLFSGRMDL